ncbi:phage holin family protein [Crenothrix sp.]|uniref:phage holin family protein n=1 Tax=Crenothrix sp. TaxID=3100433 RepID=UPI00374D6D85
MKPNTKKPEALGQTASHDDPLNGGGVLQNVQALLAELRALGHGHLLLAVLEAQRAVQSIVTMIIAGVMVALLLVGAWLGLMVAGVLGLVEYGIMATSSATLLAVGFNLLLALILCVVIMRKKRYLKFPSTLRSLKPMPLKPQDARKP